MIKILTIFTSALLTGVSFHSTILLLLFVSCVVRFSEGLLRVCFTVGDLIPVLHVCFLMGFFVYAHGFFLSYCCSAQYNFLQMITVTRTTMSQEPSYLIHPCRMIVMLLSKYLECSYPYKTK